MARRRTARRALLIAAAAALFTAPAVTPAAAHGAPVAPVSRVAACSSLSGMYASTAACRAAIAQHGGQTFDDWDNLRIAGVAGRDRQRIPDGKLCSAGLDEYRGLDLPRADWPATRLTAGARFTLTYRTTIPHSGNFELYLTTSGYDPAKPLTWSEISTQPFLTVTDPQVTNGAYHLTGRLPSDRTGRHLLYTVWRNTSTSDTYYSCSDVVLSAPKAAQQPTATATPTRSRTATPSPTPTAAPTSATPSPADRSSAPAADTAANAAATEPATQPVAASGTDSRTRLVAAAGGTAVLGGGAVAALTLRRRRR
ncbi:lytic polysaccharide monooxygenase [Streptomyces sp. NBC_01537]|uniref:lytic polysaccharide monooxygenase auxiliary activity family 9 protein n=1 Tax=Streptomyces sp. NBC_01537 TaxID=2903896 RepID=UPI00386ACED8